MTAKEKSFSPRMRIAQPAEIFGSVASSDVEPPLLDQPDELATQDGYGEVARSPVLFNNSITTCVGHLPNIQCVMEPISADEYRQRDRVEAIMGHVKALLNRALGSKKKQVNSCLEFRVRLERLDKDPGTGCPVIHFLDERAKNSCSLLEPDSPARELMRQIVLPRLEAVICALAECVSQVNEWEEQSVPHNVLAKPISISTKAQEVQAGCHAVFVDNQDVAQCTLRVFDEAKHFTGLHLEIMGKTIEIPDLLPLMRHESLPISELVMHAINVGYVRTSGGDSVLVQRKDERNKCVALHVHVLPVALLDEIPKKLKVALTNSHSRKPEKSCSLHDVGGVIIKGRFRNYFPQLTCPSRTPLTSLLHRIQSADSFRGKAPRDQQIVNWSGYRVKHSVLTARVRK